MHPNPSNCSSGAALACTAIQLRQGDSLHSNLGHHRSILPCSFPAYACAGGQRESQPGSMSGDHGTRAQPFLPSIHCGATHHPQGARIASDSHCAWFSELVSGLAGCLGALPEACPAWPAASRLNQTPSSPAHRDVFSNFVSSMFMLLPCTAAAAAAAAGQCKAGAQGLLALGIKRFLGFMPPYLSLSFCSCSSSKRCASCSKVVISAARGVYVWRLHDADKRLSMCRGPVKRLGQGLTGQLCTVVHPAR